MSTKIISHCACYNVMLWDVHVSIIHINIKNSISSIIISCTISNVFKDKDYLWAQRNKGLALKSFFYNVKKKKSWFSKLGPI